jgi:hypothetical protein
MPVPKRCLILYTLNGVRIEEIHRLQQDTKKYRQNKLDPKPYEAPFYCVMTSREDEFAYSWGEWNIVFLVKPRWTKHKQTK